MINGIMRSPQFAKATSKFMKNGIDKNYLFTGGFGVLRVLKADDNMNAQMIGKKIQRLSCRWKKTTYLEESLNGSSSNCNPPDLHLESLNKKIIYVYYEA